MKKYLLFCFLIFCLTGVNITAQTFTFTKLPPPFVASNDTGEIVDTGYINNLTGSSFQIRVIRTNQNVPTNWQTAICDIAACYPPYVDTCTAYYPVGMNEITLHFYPHQIVGQGTMTIRAEKVTNLSENYTLTFGARLDPVSVKQISSTIKDFALSQNYPNPFNPTTKINFSVPSANYVDLRVYDILGREVKVLASKFVNAGEYEVEFDAKDLASGMYYYRLQSGENVAVKKMTLVK
jgi:hypothetical protein